jgi:endonuclease-3
MTSPPTPESGHSRRRKRPRSPQGRAVETAARLAEEYPEALCELDHSNAYQLLAATILSAQCTDARVNIVTPALFARYPTPYDLAHAESGELEEIVRSTGFYASKTRHLLGMGNALLERFDGEVPTELADLVTIPGVGRKTGNVMRAVVFGLPGIAVDTHVKRLANRLGLTEADDPVKIERDLDRLLPERDRSDFGLRMILHGRRVCFARKPECGNCALEDYCPSSAVRA